MIIFGTVVNFTPKIAKSFVIPDIYWKECLNSSFECGSYSFQGIKVINGSPICTEGDVVLEVDIKASEGVCIHDCVSGQSKSYGVKKDVAGVEKEATVYLTSTCNSTNITDVTWRFEKQEWPEWHRIKAIRKTPIARNKNSEMLLIFSPNKKIEFARCKLTISDVKYPHVDARRLIHKYPIKLYCLTIIPGWAFILVSIVWISIKYNNNKKSSVESEVVRNIEKNEKESIQDFTKKDKS